MNSNTKAWEKNAFNLVEMGIMGKLIAFYILMAVSGWAAAHQGGQSYMQWHMEGHTIGGTWDVALQDLDLLLDMDKDKDNRLTRSEVFDDVAGTAAFLGSQLQISVAKRVCPTAFESPSIKQRPDAVYMRWQVSARCPAPPADGGVSITYRLLSGIDENHRGLLAYTNGKHSGSYVFSGSNAIHQLDAGQNGYGSVLADFFVEGVEHLMLGFDHLLFLLCLMIPVLFIMDGPAMRRLSDLAKTVTAFTAAHSISLTLSALHVVALPVNLVESLIAASIMVAAVFSLFPARFKAWRLALGFGFIHGFGFANVLAGLELPTAHYAVALAGFNLGVEAGQLLFVAVCLPVGLFIRSIPSLAAYGAPAASMVILVMGGFWLVERTLN